MAAQGDRAVLRLVVADHEHVRDLLQLRVEIDERTESVGRKIRDAELQKIPYMLVIGDNEAQDGTVALRRHGEGDEGTIALSAFVDRLAAEVAGS